MMSIACNFVNEQVSNIYDDALFRQQYLIEERVISIVISRPVFFCYRVNQ